MEAVMTTKAAAIHNFFSRFEIPAYAVSSVPDDADFPYITYTPVFDAFREYETNMEANIWYYGDGEAKPNAKAQEIGDYLGLSGRMLRCDEGGIWIKRGSPFCQVVTDDDDKIKRRLLNFSIEFITTS